MASLKLSRVESFRPFLLRLLAAVLFLQSGVAVAHCLRGMASGGGATIEICSSEGLKSIRLDEERQPAETGGFCAACHALPEAASPPAPRVAALAWSTVATAGQGAGVPHIGPPTRAAPYHGRAPPAG